MPERHYETDSISIYDMAHPERYEYPNPKKLPKRQHIDEKSPSFATESQRPYESYPEILNLSKDSASFSSASSSFYTSSIAAFSRVTTATPPLSSTSATNPSDEVPKDECYDEYLQCILCDYGLQLSPGGSRVTELEHSLSETELKDDVELKSTDSGSNSSALTATTLPGSKFKKISEVQKAASPSSELKTDEETPQTSSLPPLPELQPLDVQPQESGPSSKKKRKVGLYMQGPFTDPEQEKKRLNAVNAYRNRVKNKRLTQDLKEKNNRLEHVNVQCSKALKRITGEAKKLHQEIEEKLNERTTLENELRRKESEVREQREKLALFRGHLDLIASSLDDDNPARKLISTLLNKVPHETPK